MYKLSLPAASTEQLLIDPLEGLGKDGLHELVRDLANRFFARPTVPFFGTTIPIGDGVVDIAYENGVMREVEKAGLFVKRRLDPLALGYLEFQLLVAAAEVRGSFHDLGFELIAPLSQGILGAATRGTPRTNKQGGHEEDDKVGDFFGAYSQIELRIEDQVFKGQSREQHSKLPRPCAAKPCAQDDGEKEERIQLELHQKGKQQCEGDGYDGQPVPHRGRRLRRRRTELKHRYLHRWNCTPMLLGATVKKTT